MYDHLINEDFIFLLNFFIKYAKLFLLIIFMMMIIYLISFNNQYNNDKNDKTIQNLNYCLSSYVGNITNITDVYLTSINISFDYSKVYEIIEAKYYIKLIDQNNNVIKPSDLTLIYNLHLLCRIYIEENDENIYSIPNIFENKLYFCVEYINIADKAKFGIKIFKINDIDEDIEYFEQFFFDDKLIKFNLDFKIPNNNKFNVNYIYSIYNKLLFDINKSKKKISSFEEKFNLRSSFLKPPLCIFKRDIAQNEGRWYFNNIYGNYFCFCKGEACTDLKILNNYNTQSCKYFFYLTIIDNNRNLYNKADYLLSDFFDENIESSDAFPIFKEMIKHKLNAHYLTMSPQIYAQFCLNNISCNKNLKIIYGVRKINGDVLEKYLELFLKLKAVITAEQYESIDNLFYNIEYITYIFLGHGVQYIKSYLYKNYLSYKKYNKILLPPNERIINPAVEAGWKKENIIKIGLPKWDNYNIYEKNMSSYERAIFLMFTWRKIKKGKVMSDLYYNNIFNILNNTDINEQLQTYNVNLYYCFHHRLKERRRMKRNNNIKFINQNDISNLLKNCSLIITDFSAIMFDAIIQKKPLILYIPDALDNNLKDIYDSDYYETITKLKNGIIYLYEIFFDLKKVINKIIYYIKNDFTLENKKLKFYNEFNFKNKGNTKKFIRYIRMLK